MKKITLLLFAFMALAFSFNANAQCNYTLEMSDSYGDGWNGNTMDVLVNGVEVLTGVSLDDATDENGSVGTMTFSVNDGDDVTTNWIGGGLYAYETSYSILNSLGDLVGSDAEASIETGTITAVCPTCSQPVATFTVVEDCTNGFTVDIDVTDLGDAISYDVQESGISVGTITSTGVTNVGPFTNGTSIDLTLVHSEDTNCNFVETGLENTTVCPVIIDCASGTAANVTVCYGSNEDLIYSFTSTDGSALRVDFVEGYFEDCCDDIIVYDGGTITDPEILNTGTSGVDYENDATGIYAISTGDTILVRIDSDFSGSCAQGTGTPALNFNVTCNTCTPASVTAVVEDDCDNSGGFNIVVDITDLGSGISYTLSDDQESEVQLVNAVGTYTFGPYANETEVSITISSDDDDACSETFSDLTQVICPAENDTCEDAIVVLESTVNSCDNIISGTTSGATATESGTCSTTNKDVWYAFTPSETNQYIMDVTETYESSSFISTYLSVFEGSCGEFTQLGTGCYSTTYTGDFTMGTTYYVNVRSTSTTGFVNFDLCVSVAPAPPVNDEIENAIAITVDEGFCDGTNTNANNTSASGSGLGIGSCFSGVSAASDVWFTFTVPADVASVDVSTDFTGGTLTDTELAVYSGTPDNLTEIGCSQDEGEVVLSNGSSYNSLIEDLSVTVGETYYVQVDGYTTQTGTFCLDISTNETLGINNFESETAFTYYPNPVKNTLTLNAQNTIEQVAMYNMLGQEVLRTMPNAVASDLDMSNLQTGTYFVKVTIANVTETIRVIKQ